MLRPPARLLPLLMGVGLLAWAAPSPRTAPPAPPPQAAQRLPRTAPDEPSAPRPGTDEPGASRREKRPDPDERFSSPDPVHHLRKIDGRWRYCITQYYGRQAVTTCH